ARDENLHPEPPEFVEGRRMRRHRVGGWQTTRAETRYGCFLPDLTGLARRPSAANLPAPLYQVSARREQGACCPNVVVILLERGRSQDERDLGAVLGRKTDLQQVTVRSVPELRLDLPGDRVVVGADGPAVHGALFLASVADVDLARPPLDRIEKRRLQNRSRMPEACRQQVARKVTRLAVVGPAQPFALAPELDPALPPVV